MPQQVLEHVAPRRTLPQAGEGGGARGLLLDGAQAEDVGKLRVVVHLAFAIDAEKIRRCQKWNGRLQGFPPRALTGLFLVDAVVTWDWPTFATTLRYLALPAVTLAFPALAMLSRRARRKS